MISLFKKMVELCINLIIISLTNTKNVWKISQKKGMTCFVYIVTYLDKVLAIEYEISNLMII